MAKNIENQSEVVLETDSNPDDFKKFIHIKGARSNNLKNVEVRIPKNKLVVVTGVSGSGKSSLVMDTLYAEGQRRYVESLSSYARQFLDRMKKPEVDFIKGICPAIAIEQKISSGNARSTVGSLTEIYDYLRLLYARVGKTYSPVSGQIVKKHEVADVVDFIMQLNEEARIQILIPISCKHERSLGFELKLLLQKGYNRIWTADSMVDIEVFLDENSDILEQASANFKEVIYILIDRFTAEKEEENRKRISDSVLTAFSESEGDCIVHDVTNNNFTHFSSRFELDGITFLEPTHQLFNYNNPYGACPQCEGYGKMIGIDPEKVIPDDSLSLYQEAIACWRGDKGRWYYNQLIAHAEENQIPVHKPYKDLTEDQRIKIWKGGKYFHGIQEFFDELEEASYKIQNRVILSRYRGKTTCAVCNGGRLRKEAGYVLIAGKPITDLIDISVGELLDFFKHLHLSSYDQKLAARIRLEIESRLQTMCDIGLSYLSLDRHANTLSGGETQRINLTRTLGSNLINSMYILDEPSVGLHPRDTNKLIVVLKKLRDLGNTVIVVEHEEEVIRQADHLIDVGPLAGVHGGSIVFQGPLSDLVKKHTNTLTAEYLLHKKQILPSQQIRKLTHFIHIQGAREHNLKDINVSFPLQALTVISGVSGSGKTTLVSQIIYPALKKLTDDTIASTVGKHSSITGDIKNIDVVEFVGQHPMGKSSRSNPITYVKAYDSIRKLFADQQTSKIKGFEPRHFSFNVEGGRCEACAGEGFTEVEMQFLADVTLLCDECQGRRFKKDVLDVAYQGKNIYEVLDLTIDEALAFFSLKKDIIQKLKPLSDVGLGYVKLGQASSTLSGGEAQRVKLASFMTKEYSTKRMLFIFDEPTTGLHFHDVQKLMTAFQTLVEHGHTVMVVEHNLDVIRCADYLIDLGPEGGKAGGDLVYQGIPEGIIDIKDSYTGKYLKERLTHVHKHG